MLRIVRREELKFFCCNVEYTQGRVEEKKSLSLFIIG